MSDFQHEPQVLPIWGITDATCYMGFCNDCGWIGPTRAVFEEADEDVEGHCACVEPDDMI